MDIDQMITKYEYKAKVEKIAGGNLFKSEDLLVDLYKLKATLEQNEENKNKDESDLHK